MFNELVIAIAALVLIASLGWFAYEIHNNKTVSKAYPPTFSGCPDYWEKDSSGRCIVPLTRNAPFSGNARSTQKQLSAMPFSSYLQSNPQSTVSQFYYANPGYTPGYTAATPATSSTGESPATVDFSAPAWKDYGTSAIKGSADCIYREWANRVGVTWDGITNYNQC